MDGVILLDKPRGLTSPDVVARLRAAGMLDEAERERLEAGVDEEVADAVAFAEAGTWEPESDLGRFVYSERAESRP